MKTDRKSIVIFRAMLNHTIAAVFPAKGPNVWRGNCLVYWLYGSGGYWTQHRYTTIIARSKPATKNEYNAIKKRLESDIIMTQRGYVGYDLVIKQRRPSKTFLSKWINDGNK